MAMKGTHRILVSLVLLVTFWGLSFVGTRSEGPLGRLLSATGVMVTEVESWFTRAVRGKGREAQLAWFQP